MIQKQKLTPLWLIMAIYSLAIVGLVSSCGGGGDTSSGGDPTPTDEIIVSVSGLKPATQYYWKVVSSDGINTVESSIRSFTTQLMLIPEI